MLGGLRLRLSFTPERTCFAYINSKYSSSKENECIQLLCKGKKWLLWVIFTSSVPDRQILCNPLFCRILGLDEGLEVFVSPCPELKVLDELFIDTDSPEDQEILEHNAELLQLHILDQLRLVVANQKAVVWISVAMPIVFTPKRTGILMNQSRIIVKVDPFDTYKGLKQKPPDLPNETKPESNFNNVGLINETMLKPYLNIPKKKVFRAIPIDSDGKKNLIHPYTTFIHEDFVDTKLKENNVILATMDGIPLITQQKENRVENESEKNNVFFYNLCVEIVPINNVVFRSLSREVYNKHVPTILIPKSLNNIINIENGMKIIVTLIDSIIDQPEHIHIETYSEKVQNEKDVIDKFKRCVVENTNSGKKFLINDGFVKQNFQISTGFIKFNLKPEILKYTMLNSESFRQCSISAKCSGEEELSGHKPVNKIIDFDFNIVCRTMRIREDIVQKVVLHLNFEMHREALYIGVSEIKSNVLITGLSGSGKSTLCQIIQKELTVWSHIIHCRSLKGRKDIPEVLEKAIFMCQEHSPAVLICDDVDSLVPPNLDGMPPQDMAYYQRLAIVIKHILQSCPGVCVLMTSLELRALHPTLKQCSGKPLFTAHFDIPELDMAERSELFNFLLNDKVRNELVVENDDVAKMAADTAGHNARDITDYLNKKIFKAVKRKSVTSDKPRLLEAVSENKEQTAAYDVWGEVGGMHHVKKQLTESIFWPMMYPSLFPSQSCGLLLYGPPGTGKSFIGSSLARVHNVNFICVKGPELLSKYIGQSEKAVRDIFDKADMKRPCILFFDEFDSLAPKRGHDSTGVTDRVVNQLLSRLDGAEGGARGPVLVATARPDLLDPALLRAGRIHTHVYCGLPNFEDRKEVLRILSDSVNVCDDVSLEDIARRTEGFSPADLKSLLVTAQLTRLEKQLDTDEGNLEEIEVCEEDIEAALLETKPSLSAEQRHYYDTIYKRFRGESLSPQQTITTSFQKQKVTLA